MAQRTVLQFVSIFSHLHQGPAVTEKHRPTDLILSARPFLRYLSQYPHCFPLTDRLAHYHCVMNVRTHARGQTQVERQRNERDEVPLSFLVIALTGDGSEALMPTISPSQHVVPYRLFTLHLTSCQCGTRGTEILLIFYFCKPQPATDNGLITSKT